MFTAAGKAASSSSAVYVEDVFSTFLYTGNGSTQTINNGIDLAGKGGLVWIKGRSVSTDHALYDTVRGATFDLVSNSSAAQTTQTTGLTAFNSNGFSIGALSKLNFNAATYASWTFREQAKFFDVVTYTGNGTTRTIAHNLGSVPGCIIVKSLGAATQGGADGFWYVYHRGLSTPQSGAVFLNNTDQRNGAGIWNFTSPTSTEFSVSSGNDTSNITGRQYVAYLFAHNAGGFGPAGTDNVISCGSYTGDGSNPGPTITLGYEPQWVLIKNSTDAGWDWYLGDNMRGIPWQSTAVATPIQTLRPNLANAEAGQLGMNILATGFQPTSTSAGINASGSTYIYIAIRRGPMKTPTSGTSVFSPVLVSQTDIQQTSGGTFPPDFVFMSTVNGTQRIAYVNQIADRLRGLGVPSDTFSTSTDGLTLVTASTASDDASNSYIQLKANGIDITRGGGWNSTDFRDFIYYLMRRSPGFLDVVCYTGTGSNRTVTHNLTVVPELMIVKRRDLGSGWYVYNSTINATDYLILNSTDARDSSSSYWNNTAPTNSVFTVGTNGAVNNVGNTYVAYLFATCPGVSKVGSYTGTGALQTINCGFAAGARLVLIKRTDSTGDWWGYDSARGITSGNDPYFFFNTTAAQVTNTNYVDTTSVGFQVTAAAPAGLNANGGTYIFLAIA